MRPCQRFAADARLIVLQATKVDGLGFEEFWFGYLNSSFSEAEGGKQRKEIRFVAKTAKFATVAMVIKKSNFCVGKARIR